MTNRLYKFIHSHYHRKYLGVYSHAKQLFIFDISLVGLSFILLLASIWLYFWKPGVADLVDIRISLGTERLLSGDEMKIHVTYKNRSKVTLKNAHLSFHLPIGFSANKELSTSTTNIVLPDIRPGESGEKFVYGTIWTRLKTEQSIGAIISFNQEGKGTLEQSYGRYLLYLPDSALVGEIDIATSSFSNTTLPFSFKLKNTGKANAGSVRITSNAKLTNTNMNDIGILPGEEKIVTGNILTPRGSDSYVFSLTPYIKVGDGFFEQRSFQKTIKVYDPKIELRAEIVSALKYAEAGMDLPVEISWKNLGSDKLKNERIKLIVPPGTVDLARTVKQNGIKRDGFDLVIDQNNLDTGTSTYTHLILPSDFSGVEGNIQKLTIKPVFEAEMDEVPDQTYKFVGNTLSIPLATDVKLVANARYYTDEGDQLGRGPLPPQVGETTKYWIFVNVWNTVNPLRNTSLRVQLSPGVRFTGKQSVTIGKQLTAENGIVNWALTHDAVPNNSQNGFYFEVSVNPTPDQIGKPLELVRSVSFTAEDDVVGKKFDLQRTNISNILLKSDRGSELPAEVSN